MANLKSYNISFDEMEHDYLCHVKKHFGRDRVRVVGLALPPDDDLTTPANRGGSSLVPCHKVPTCLDSRMDHSFTFVLGAVRCLCVKKKG